MVWLETLISRQRRRGGRTGAERTSPHTTSQEQSFVPPHRLMQTGLDLVELSVIGVDEAISFPAGDHASNEQQDRSLRRLPRPAKRPGDLAVDGFPTRQHGGRDDLVRNAVRNGDLDEMLVGRQ